MKLRLVGNGFETYTGQMGVIDFADGLSVNEVSVMDATRVAGIIGAEWEDGTPANVSQHYIDNINTQAPVFEQLEPTQETLAPQVETIPAEAQAEVSKASAVFTQEQLAKIADEEGIAGLRAIATPLNIKGNSIVGLIDAIVKTGGVPVPGPTEEVQ